MVDFLFAPFGALRVFCAYDQPVSPAWAQEGDEEEQGARASG
jgi:hypothetical protein